MMQRSNDQFLGKFVIVGVALAAAAALALPTGAAPHDSPDVDLGNGGDPPPPPVITCAQDVDGDGYVGFQDVMNVLLDWGECPIVPKSPAEPVIGDDAGRRECSRADVDGDKRVGVMDLILVLDAYGFHCARITGG
jgi:hypothetical protein